jgi:hypothetical protein
MTSPLPPVPQDPAFLEGQQVKATFAEQSQLIREDFGITDVAKAEQITAAWEAANTTLAGLWRDLQARREARIDELEALIPVGPGVPPNTSPADTAVLMQAWRGALARAQEADPKALQKMFDEAQRFDDDVVLRAVLTVSRDDFDGGGLVRKWAALNGVTDIFEELSGLYDQVSGSDIWRPKLVFVLGQIEEPQEAWDLPVLTAARDASLLAAGRGAPKNAYRVTAINNN